MGCGRGRCLLLQCVAVLAFGAGQASGVEAPAVARATIVGGQGARTSGTSFFIPVSDGQGGVGVAGVAAAHSFDPAELARAKEVEFKLGRSKDRVSVSSRLLAPPGRALSAAGGTVRDDFLLFALDLKPDRVRVLEPDPVLPSSGRRVQILGVPSQIAADQDDLFGSVVAAGNDKIEVELDAAADLRGWGGAPVLDHGSKKVIGILEAAWPKGGTFHVAVAPIGAVVAASWAALDGGRGRAFASFPATPDTATAQASPSAPPAGAPSPTAASPAVPPNTPPTTSASAATTSTRSAGPTAPASTASTPNATPPHPMPAPTPHGVRPPEPPMVASAEDRAATQPHGPLLGAAPAAQTELQLSVERPIDGEIVGDASGAFVAGRALALSGEFKHFDVMIVIDTSGSTFEPTGADVNGNGVVGTATFGGLFGIGSTDPGDSILSAEVMAARQLLDGLDARSTRVGLITFAGEPEQGGLFAAAPPPAAITEEPLTTDYDRIRRALGAVLQRGPAGATHMAAGADQATIELKGLRGALSQVDPKSEKIVLFLTDGQPTLPGGPGYDSVNVNAVLRAADRAHRAGVRFHAFAIGPEALAGPVAAVELAARTGGYFTPVRNPGDIVQVVEQVRFSNVESVTLKNLSTGETAKHVLTNADGSYAGLVPVQSGLNRIQVTAVADNGARAEQIVQVSYVPGTASPSLPRELIAQRNKLLEQKLVELRRERAEVEQESVEKTRKELALEMERERAKAQEQAERQRKELELELEKKGASTP